MAVMIRAAIVAAVAIVMLTMMIATGIRIIRQRSGSERLCRRIRRTLHAGIESDASVSQRHLRTHTDPAANQSVNFCSLQETGKRAVAAAVGIHDLFSDDLSVFNIIQLELLGMSEMLKDRSVFISHCDSH